VFYENLQYLSCGAELGYSVADDRMHSPFNVGSSVEPGDLPPIWRPCINRESIACNWLATTGPAAADRSATAAPEGLCDCCRYTRVIAPLDDVANHQAWHRLEQAKRYLFHSLHALRLPIPDRIQQPDTGLTFEFLVQLPPGSRADRTCQRITTSVEADDVGHEQRRVSLHEPYRTLLGHLRHEIGHFYWDQLLAGKHGSLP
jgi:hypothetical protein